MDCWKLACGGLFQDTEEEEEESVITYPHLRILPTTSADNPRNISLQFTRLNIRSSAHRIFVFTTIRRNDIRVDLRSLLVPKIVLGEYICPSTAMLNISGMRATAGEIFRRRRILCN